MKTSSQSDKFYTDFYSTSDHPYFLQGDLIRELRFSHFNKETHLYEKRYYDTILLSNTCDMDEANHRIVDKQVLIARLVPLNMFIESLDELKLTIKQSAEIVTQIKNQQFTNVLYLPPISNGEEYLAYFDQVNWISNEELSLLKESFTENRIATLDFFGYYLLVLKLSYHFCRLPEETHRY